MRINIVERGMLAKSKAGHDKGHLYVIYDVDETYVYLVDGEIMDSLMLLVMRIFLLLMKFREDLTTRTQWQIREKSLPQ